jgi:DNA-binding transcriptional ArsR family regulator
MKEESIFLDYVGDNPRMRILQYLIEGRDFDYTLTDLLNAGVSWGTLNTLVPKLLELGIVVKTRKIGRATLYKINRKNFAVKQLIGLYDNLILEKLNHMEEESVKNVEVPA